MNTRQGIVGAFKLAQAIVTPQSEMSEKRLKLCLEPCKKEVNGMQIPVYNENTGQCNDCGCFVRQKVKLVNEVCPLGKW